METIATPSCNNSTLAPFESSSNNPWNTDKIKHVFRRLGFGASLDDVDNALSLNPGQFIESLVNSAKNMAPTQAPFWANYATTDFSNYSEQNYQYFMDWRLQSTKDFLRENLRGRLAFFWMNHFVTRFDDYFHSPYAFQYYNLMQKYAVGNFKEFTREIGLTPSMLIFLDGFYNTKLNANENYARELYELFSIGEGNGYTQTDITNTARALTGYNTWNAPNGKISFTPEYFDNGEKTIFGRTGNWGYNDVIDILFAERGQQVATYICTKLYKFFVSPAVDSIVHEDIIQPLAQTMIDNDFEMAPVFKLLFKSQHFFDETAIGTVIKSPFDIVLNFMKETGFHTDDEILQSMIYYCEVVGQHIYNPDDVAGWQRDEAWINSSTLTGRWSLTDGYLNYLHQQDLQASFVVFAKNLTNNSKDPYFIAKVLVDHFVPKELHTPNDYEIAADVLKWEVPQNYYDEEIWSLDWESAPVQVMYLLKHISKMPEFQLK